MASYKFEYRTKKRFQSRHTANEWTDISVSNKEKVEKSPYGHCYEFREKEIPKPTPSIKTETKTKKRKK